MTVRITPVIVIVFMLLVAPCRGQEQNEALQVDLSGAWQFKTGDNLAWKLPAANQGDWRSIQVPARWESRGYSDYDGYAWYRRAFKVPPGLAEGTSVILHLGRIDDVDEVYLNGSFVGATGGMPPSYYSAYDAVREYTIPPGLLHATDENVISVRVYDRAGDGGIVEGQVGLSVVNGSEPDLIRLDGSWSFRTGDDPSWSQTDVEKEGWTTITVPGNWEPQGFRDYDGYAWYRKEFFLPVQAEPSPFVLRLGKIDDIDAAYVNGTLVGRTGAIDRGDISDDDWKKDREYSVPSELLHFGDYNVIAVRVFDATGGGGLYEGPHALYREDIDEGSLQHRLQSILKRVTGS